MPMRYARLASLSTFAMLRLEQAHGWRRRTRRELPRTAYDMILTLFNRPKRLPGGWSLS